MRTIVLFFLFLFTCSTQTNAQQLTDEQIKSTAHEVDEVFKEMLVYGEKLDYDKLTSGVDDTRAVGFITNGKYYALFSTLIMK
ncbi:MAG: hypothetical protein HC906_08770 [Bacteroidales bacterium]|nr:hypothetical protein [Bacteroidales bacterium]